MDNNDDCEILVTYDNLIYKYSTVMNKDIKIEIGDILEYKVDAIVNMSINKESPCDTNRVFTKALIDLLGSNLTNQLSLYKKLLHVPNEFIYQIAVTTGHRTNDSENSTSKKIKFNTIYHCYLEFFDYMSNQSERSYKSLLNNIFRLASTHNFKSIAIPVYGYVKDYPASYLAKWFDDAIKDFLLLSYLNTLETIRIVVYKNDHKCIEEFKNYFSQNSNQLTELKFKNLNDKYQLISLDPSKEEFEIVSKHFNITMPNAKITKIHKVINESQELMYMTSRKIIESKNSLNKSFEYNLFHGTSKDSIEPICKFGFNRNFSGKNGTAYGKGVYFARDSKYSHDYCKDPFTWPVRARKRRTTKKAKVQAIFHEYRMFLCSVLVGTYELVKNSSHSNPFLDTSEKNDGCQFDSGVNDLDDPTIFVIYKDYRALPKYLIDYSIQEND